MDLTDFTYHPDHDDLTDDVVIRSSDGVYFRASSHKLSRAKYSLRLFAMLQAQD